MAERRRHEDEGLPAPDENAPERPSDEEEVVIPDDRPAMSDDRVTPSEQRERERVTTRAAREQPEAAEQERHAEKHRTSRRLVEGTQGGRDVVAELEADETPDDAGLTAEESAVTIREADEQMPDEPSTDQASGRGADRGG